MPSPIQTLLRSVRSGAFGPGRNPGTRSALASIARHDEASLANSCIAHGGVRYNSCSCRESVTTGEATQSIQDALPHAASNSGDDVAVLRETVSRLRTIADRVPSML